MMSNISKAAKLSRIYSNHCIRATCITVLNDSGFEGRHIVTVSGHRSEESIKNYCSDTSDKQKRDMSKSISEFTMVHNDSSNQQLFDNDMQFDDSISENELVLSASQTDEVINDIVQGHAQLQPLTDITNIHVPTTSSSGAAVQSGLARTGSTYGSAPCSLMFHNCSVTINMAQP